MTEETMTKQKQEIINPYGFVSKAVQEVKKYSLQNFIQDVKVIAEKIAKNIGYESQIPVDREISSTLKEFLDEYKGKGKLPGSEAHLKTIFKNVEIGPSKDIEFELLAGRAGAFKPRSIQMIIVSEDSKHPVEILDVTVMGCPQFVSYTGYTVKSDRGLAQFYSEMKPVDWSVFGASAGQGLNIRLYNPSRRKVKVYVCLWGDAANMSLIGRV